MIIEFTLDEKDYLSYQLYAASKSERIKKKRIRSKLIVPLIYLGIGFWSLLQENYFFGIGIIVFALAWFIFYPAYEKRHYMKHYQGFIKENYQNRMGQPVFLEFNTDYLTARDKSSESKVTMQEIEIINEIPSNIFIKLKNGSTLIIPKEKIKDLNQLITHLKTLAESLSITYNTENNWQWK